MRTQAFFVITFILNLLFVPSANAAEKIIINIASGPPITNPEGTGFLNRIVREVFARLGKEGEVVVYQSSARGLANANAGHDDGVGLRVKGLEKKFPNLIRVPEPIIVNKFVAFSLSGSDVAGLKTDTWDVLSPYYVSHILGWQIFENNLGDHKKTTRVKGNRQLFTLLKNERTQLALHEQWQGLWHAQQMNMAVEVLQPPLAQREMFMYLHNKHEDKISAVSQVLRDMKADGSYQKIILETLEALLPRG